jgi:hypothetical protein
MSKRWSTEEKLIVALYWQTGVPVARWAHLLPLRTLSQITSYAIVRLGLPSLIECRRVRRTSDARSAEIALSHAAVVHGRHGGRFYKQREMNHG